MQEMSKEAAIQTMSIKARSMTKPPCIAAGLTSAAASASPLQSGGAASSSRDGVIAVVGHTPPAGAVVRRPIELRYHTVLEARQLMPQGRNCGSITIHDGNHSWLVKYPTDTLPKSKSRVFLDGDVDSHMAAMRTCLAWAWRHHSRLTGEECPWDLGEPI